MVAGARHAMVQQVAAQTVPAPQRRDGQVEQMSLARRRHHHVITDHFASGLTHPHAVAGVQRIGKIAEAPRVIVTGELDPVDARQIGFGHRPHAVTHFEYCAHALRLARRSSTVSATLSRR